MQENTPSLLQTAASYPQLVNHEESIVKTPYNVTAWMAYLDDVDGLISDKNNKDKDSLVSLRDLVGRRAVQLLPKSYKLWKAHWEFCGHHKRLSTKLWERALVTLHKFPRVWMEYLTYAHEYSNQTPTQLRRLANRALEALPVTQHEKVWPTLLHYYESTSSSMPKETKLSMLRRYIQFNPNATQQVADFLANQLGHWGEAALLYVHLLNDQPELTMHQRKDLWMSLAKICTRHPVEEVGLDWDCMVRATLRNKNYLPTELEGVVWNQLADSWIRRGEFQLARSVYEEALESVSKVRDFTILLDAYLQFEEGLLEATMEAQAENEEENENATEGENDDDWDLLLPNQQPHDELAKSASSMSDLELALARAEDLTARRPLLLNRVLLRQNPHDVGEWLKRARLFKENEQLSQAAAALEEGLRTVRSRRAVGGNPSQMVSDLIQIYESDMKDVAQARDLLDRVCNQWLYEFKNVDDLAECHAAWVELELRQESWDDALDIIRKSVVVPPNAPKMVKGLTKSLRLWDLLLDLEESLGTVQTTKDAYNNAMEQRVATPLHLLNYASFLKEHKYFEESFSAYERGIELFEFPGVKVIWKAYLEAFLKRYEGTKLERTRDLFQRCVEACPQEECAEFFLMYGKFEEEYGLTKRALGVYRDMCNKVPAEEKYTSYQLFIAKTTQYMGQTATRDIYQSAIEKLEDEYAAELCLDFAKMETSLQEIDRARAVLSYGAQLADPRRNEQFWKDWNEFEITHGNEETFRDMLRIKRSVEASFSTVNYNAAEMSTTTGKVENLSNEEAMKMIAEREGVELEPQARPAMPGFVSASSSKRTGEAANLEDVEERVAKLRKVTAMGESLNNADAEQESATNDDDDEIDIDDLDDDDGENAKAVQSVSTKAVPAAVFGGLAKMVGDGNEQKEESAGALERLRAAKKDQ